MSAAGGCDYLLILIGAHVLKSQLKDEVKKPGRVNWADRQD